MSEAYTPAVARALAAATEAAARAGAEAESWFLFLTLISEDEGKAAGLLDRAGFGADARARLADLPPRSAPAGTVRAALAAARAIARDNSGEVIPGSDHLLLALVRTDTALRLTLEELGLDLDALEEAAAADRPAPLELAGHVTVEPATERVDTDRLLDACGNRAREALRVIEDYCRFSLDDLFLTRQLKEFRHELAQTLEAFDISAGLAARDTQRDVGTAVSTPTEQARYSPAQVAAVNCKRLQEALRSLEEFGKLRGPQLGTALERLRYRSYTLERVIGLGESARQRLAGVRLCVLLTGAQSPHTLDWVIQEAAEGGAGMFQLREKSLSDRQLLERAVQVRRWTRRAGALFIVNDRPDIARLAEADGVHLGQDDLPVKEARRILGPEALIGVSTHDLEQLRRAVLDGASYVGVGPTFPSSTKRFEELAGLEYVRVAAAETTLPAFAIGGITPTNAAQVAAAGLRRTAVSAAVTQAEEPRHAAAALVQALSG